MPKYTVTDNGAKTLADSGNPLVNLFFNIGASRNNLDNVRKNFTDAYGFDAIKAAAILLWARDIRHNGAGERLVFRTILKDMAINVNPLTKKVINLVKDIGRFDDLRAVLGTVYEAYAVSIWADAIKNKDVLAAKWADRGDKFLQKALNLNEAGLRKLLSSIRKEHLVETKMCEKAWTDIDFSKLPSVAGARYAKAFHRNDGDRYREFLGDDTKKVNASAVFPYDVYRMYRYAGEREAASKYWDNLPELELAGNILPISDVSGSMMCGASGQITCLDVCISLSVYLAQRCKGKFQNTLMTFSASPTLVTLPQTKDLGTLFDFVARMNWDMNTDIQRAYERVLEMAKNVNATQSDLPDYLLIMSDMQFDCVRGGSKTTIYDDMRKKFAAAGYKLPKVVFWNLNARAEQFPSLSFGADTALVSGFSPNILKAVLNAKDMVMTPEIIMDEAIAPFIEMLK